MPKGLFWHLLGQEAVDIVLRHAPPGWDVTPARLDTPEPEKLSLVHDAEFFMMLPAMAMSEEFLQACPKLRFVQLIGTGYERIQPSFPVLAKRGIPVANTPSANAPSVAEHTIALLLAIYKRLLDRDRTVRQGLWKRESPAYLDAFDLVGKTIGYLGMGNMGQAVAVRLQNFGMRQLYYKRTSLPLEEEARLKVQYAPLETLLRESDIVSVLVSLSPETRGMLGADEAVGGPHQHGAWAYRG